MSCPQCGASDLLIVDNEQACEKCQWHTPGFPTLRPKTVDDTWREALDYSWTQWERLLQEANRQQQESIEQWLRLQNLSPTGRRVLAFQQQCANERSEQAPVSSSAHVDVQPTSSITKKQMAASSSAPVVHSTTKKKRGKKAISNRRLQESERAARSKEAMVGSRGTSVS